MVTVEGRSLSKAVEHHIEQCILSEKLSEGDQVPSWNKLASQFEISPSTAAVATRTLSEKGLLIKRRGQGFFVADSARSKLLSERRAQFEESFLSPLLAEAHRLGYSVDDVVSLISNRT